MTTISDAALVRVRQSFIPGGGRVLLLGRPAKPAEWTTPAAAKGWRLAADTAAARRFDYVWISPVVPPAAALRRLEPQLRLRRAEFIEMPVGPDSASLFDALTGFGYSVFGLFEREMRHFPTAAAMAAEPPPVLLAAAPRHWKRLTRQQGMIDLAQALPRHGVASVRGVIHVGAHHGEELPTYRRLGAEKIVFVEADPLNFAELAARVGGEPGVVCLPVAISDRAGEATFTRMNASQSGSLLTPKLHLTVHPGVVPTERFAVRTATLPATLAEWGLSAADYDLLALDIQGAEGLALRGAADLSPGLRAVSVEVNYAEVYEGCADIDDIDDLLFAAGLERAEECSPFHASWGDALYVRR